MTRPRWTTPVMTVQPNTDVPLARIIQAIDTRAPGTLAELAAQLDLTEDHVSRRVRELKEMGAIRKAYVVDRERIYDISREITKMQVASGTETNRQHELFHSLEKLSEVTTDQFTLAAECFEKQSTEPDIFELEALARERFEAALVSLKSYGLTTAWPGPRVAGDLATVARHFLAVGHQCRFLVDALNTSEQTISSGVCYEYLCSAFDAGFDMVDPVEAIIFDADLDLIDDLTTIRQEVFSDLDELFEMASAYDVRDYGVIVTVARALERVIQAWLDAANVAALVHTGLAPE